MQKDLPTRQEVRRRMKAYNDLYNEGSEGYVPYIHCIEERDYAVDQIAVYQEKIKELTAQKQHLLFDHATEYCIYQIKEGEAYHGIRFFSSEDQEKWVPRFISAIMIWYIMELWKKSAEPISWMPFLQSVTKIFRQDIWDIPQCQRCNRFEKWDRSHCFFRRTYRISGKAKSGE